MGEFRKMFSRLALAGVRWINIIHGQFGIKSLKGRVPAIVTAASNRRTPFLMGFVLLPTVHAFWGKKSDSKDESKEPSTGGPTLKNKKDVELLQDLKFADRVYVVDEGITFEEIHKKLSKHKDKKEPELLWRLARVTFELAKKAKSNDEKVKLVNEAFEIIQHALEIDENNFATHKWMAILLNARSTLIGTKEQITQSYNVRAHFQKAVDLNPKDATSIYLLGNWCFTVADIPWYQKKIASTIFATPPSCSFQEAVQHFMKAEETQPRFYSMNLLMLAKSYIRLGEPDKAEVYLLKLKEMPMITEEDYQARLEGKELLDKIVKSKKSGAPSAPSA